MKTNPNEEIRLTDERETRVKRISERITEIRRQLDMIVSSLEYIK